MRHSAGADFADSVEQSGFGPDPLRAAIDCRRLRLVQSGYRDIAVVIVQGGQQSDQRGQRVGHHPAPDTRVQTVIEGRDLDDTVDKPA